MTRRLEPWELARVLRHAAGVGPYVEAVWDALVDISWLELDACVARAYERALDPRVGPGRVVSGRREPLDTDGQPAVAARTWAMPARDDYRAPAWLADVVDPGSARGSRVEF